MFSSLPDTAQVFMSWSWEQIEPYYHELAARRLTAATLAGWLADWTRLLNLLGEMRSRLYTATTRNTADPLAEQRYQHFSDAIAPAVEAADYVLKRKLLDSGLEAPDFKIPLRNMRVEVELYTPDNLALRAEERNLAVAYNKLISAQTIEWHGQELTLTQLQTVYQQAERAERERAWRLAAERQLADREAIGTVWQALMDVRGRQAANAGFADYRAFRWRQMLRFDYTPEDCQCFQHAIEEVAVPAAARVYARRRQRLGLPTLRPWDLDVDVQGRPPLRPFESPAELEAKASAIFHHVHPCLGDYFDLMRREGLLDLENRKGKAPGAYCTRFEVEKRPFLFMNAVGVHADVRTILHESGHAFHVFEAGHWPYFHQSSVSMEFAEVASMGMELLATPYWVDKAGGFYSELDTKRARIKHLEKILLFWPYMAVVDAFQHWVYQHHAVARDPQACDAQWITLWRRFMTGVDWTDLEEFMAVGWQHKLHIHRHPFYYVEYGIAQLGALQVWRNALNDQAAAVARYRNALSLGGTQPLPALYQAAGAHFAFDAATLRTAVDLVEKTIDVLEEV